jgi:hypothetical protein
MVDEPSGSENVQDVKDGVFIDHIERGLRNWGHRRGQCRQRLSR